MAYTWPLHPLPPSVTDPTQITRLEIRRHQPWAGILNEYQDCRLTCPDEVFGERRAEDRTWPCNSMAPLRVSVW